MASVIDLWRAVDPEARLLSGSSDRLRAAVLGVSRTRALPPHLPDRVDGQLLVVGPDLGPWSALDGLVLALREAGLRPVAVLLAALDSGGETPERAGDPIPILASHLPIGTVVDRAAEYLERPEEALQRLTAELRLTAAEAALADPRPATAAGVVAARLRRGVAVSADGQLLALHPRPAGRALAARFAALHGRLLIASPGRASARQSREGIWLLERRIRQGASVWLFDDVPFARIDEVAAEALTITLRALLARPADERRSTVRAVAAAPPAAAQSAGEGDVLRETLLAVARANGRVAPAARLLGVHRNTVLYRLHRASDALGLDPRRPEDALRILREAEPARG